MEGATNDRQGLTDAREDVHVVLVEPGDSLNVGAVARAMSNMGFANLRLVAPPRLNLDEAARTACWAEEMVRQAPIFPTLAEALAPMREVVGFTARHGRHRPRHAMLDDWCGGWLQRRPGPTALLFGPEDTGLRAEHITSCRWLVRIPSREENPSFNLAQAVLLGLYELERALPAPSEEAPAQGPPLAQEAELTQLERIVEEVLVRSGFYGKGTPAPLPGLVKHMLRRIVPDTREMPVLLGMFDRINRTLSGRSPAQPFPPQDESPPEEPTQEVKA